MWICKMLIYLAAWNTHGLVKHEQLECQESRNLFVFGLGEVQLRLVVAIEIEQTIHTRRRGSNGAGLVHLACLFLYVYCGVPDCLFECL